MNINKICPPVITPKEKKRLRTYMKEHFSNFPTTEETRLRDESLLQQLKKHKVTSPKEKGHLHVNCVHVGFLLLTVVTCLLYGFILGYLVGVL